MIDLNIVGELIEGLVILYLAFKKKADTLIAKEIVYVKDEVTKVEDEVKAKIVEVAKEVEVKFAPSGSIPGQKTVDSDGKVVKP